MAKPTKNISFHPEIETQIEEWLIKRDAPAFLLLGPPGVGKTTLTYRVAEKRGYYIKEYNASHIRTGSIFRTQLLPQIQQAGITAMCHSNAPNGKLLLLDEIDGMSQGERGGIKQLLDYLRDKDRSNTDCPMILICNEIRGRAMQQLQKICKSFIVERPNRDRIEEYLGGKIPDTWYKTGDLRRIFRWFDQVETFHEKHNDEISTDPNHSQESLSAAWHTLYEVWDIFEELELETKDVNLAGLLFHENLNKRLAGYTFDDYLKIFKYIRESDRADYWAFFHQCWNLLYPSYMLKLKIPNQFLQEYPVKVGGKISQPSQLVYTQVLTKQSLLYNVWKEMASMSDSGIDIRLQPSYVEISTEKNQVNIGLSQELKDWSDLECRSDIKMKRSVKSRNTQKNVV
jgi:GTPase SAR1 family protein